MGFKLPEKAKNQRGGDLGQPLREKVMAESERNQISLTLDRYFNKKKKERETCATTINVQDKET